MSDFFKWSENNLQVLSWFLVSMGLMFLIAPILKTSIATYQLSKSPAPEYFAEMTIDKSPLFPTKVKIADQSPVDVAAGFYEDGQWSLDQSAALFLVSSAVPNLNAGNTIIYGHNTNHIFGGLKKLSGNEIIELTLANGEVRSYQVKKIEIVKPEQISVLKQTDYPELTIYTCTGWLDSQRLIIKAEPIILTTR